MRAVECMDILKSTKCVQILFIHCFDSNLLLIFVNFLSQCYPLFLRDLWIKLIYSQVAGNFHFAPGKSFQQHHVHGKTYLFN